MVGEITIIQRIKMQGIEGLDLSYDKAAEIWNQLVKDGLINESKSIELISDDYRLVNILRDDYGKITSINVSTPLENVDLENLPYEKLFVSRNFELNKNKGLVLLVNDEAIKGLDQYEGKVYDGKLDVPELVPFIGKKFGGEYSVCYELTSFDLNIYSLGRGFLNSYPSLYQEIRFNGQDRRIIGIENLGFVEKEDDFFPQEESIFRQRLLIYSEKLSSQ